MTLYEHSQVRTEEYVRNAMNKKCQCGHSLFTHDHGLNPNVVACLLYNPCRACDCDLFQTKMDSPGLPGISEEMVVA